MLLMIDEADISRQTIGKPVYRGRRRREDYVTFRNLFSQSVQVIAQPRGKTTQQNDVLTDG